VKDKEVMSDKNVSARLLELDALDKSCKNFELKMDGNQKEIKAKQEEYDGMQKTLDAKKVKKNYIQIHKKVFSVSVDVLNF
jgi:predicted  nucleic acid-binding Zn-ribbon protein